MIAMGDVADGVGNRNLQRNGNRERFDGEDSHAERTVSPELAFKYGES
jgi:hypothetical protein